jgi:hypothetical protein
MEPEHGRHTSVEAVRCLRCGVAYSKPTGPGSLAAHAGCPDCSYVGWRPSGPPAGGLGVSRFEAAPLMPASPHARFGAGPLRLPPPRSG